MNIAEYMSELGQRARAASRLIARADTSRKNAALEAMARVLDASRAELAEANLKDLAAGRTKWPGCPMLDRLELTPARIDTMIEGLRQVAALPDPIGGITDMNYRPSGIQVGKMRVPLGVIGIIYESRPNVTVEAASLCLKSAMPPSCAGAPRRSIPTTPSLAASLGGWRKRACRRMRCRWWKPPIGRRWAP